MKKIIYLILLAGLASVVFWPGGIFAAVKKPAVKVKPLILSDISGRLALQKESDNKFWYIEPKTKERYFLRNQDDIDLLVDKFAVTPTNSEFKKIAKNKKIKTPASLVRKYSGRIIISPASSTQAYYLNPGDGIAYVISSYDDFYAVGKVLGWPLTDVQLRLAAMNKIQDTYDPAYYGIAYVRYDGQIFSGGRETSRLLSLASLTKVMTALVLSDLNMNWEKTITITPEEIRYPCTLQACGSTSEVDLKASDRVRAGDLFIAMLAASSNQSAVILADNSGLSRKDFVKKMNNKAKELGLIKTKFVEMSGLSADNVSTAEEFAKIAKAAFGKELVSSATRQSDYIFSVQQADGSPRSVEVLNRNYSLLAMGPDASKSGYLIEAQRNAVVQKAGQVAVALHCYSLTQRNDIIKRLLEGDEVAQARY